MTTNELTEYGLTRERDLDRLLAQLSADAGQLEMQDRLNTLGAHQSVYGQMSADDLARAGFYGNQANFAQQLALSQGQALAGMTTAEQQAALARAGLSLEQARGVAGLAGSEFRDELAAAQFNAGQQGQALQVQQYNQGWQNTLQQQALNDAIRQIQLQAGLQNQQFGQDIDWARLQAQVGYMNDPYSLMLGGAQQAGQMGQYGLAGLGAYGQATGTQRYY